MAFDGRGREIGGLNEYFGEIRGWIEFPRATTRDRSRNKSTGQPEWAGNSSQGAESVASRRAKSIGQAREYRPVEGGGRKQSGGAGSETHAGASRTAKEVSWIKRAS